MKCPDDDCHFETTDKIKFCPKCGSKLVSNSDKDPVVLCTGRNEDGSVCNTELNQTLKFCSKCGTKVDPKLFSSHEERCHGCSLRLKAVDVFCSECGLKKGQYPETTPLEHEKDKGIVQHISEGMEHMSEVESGTETTAPFDVTHKSTSGDGQLPQDQLLTFATLTSDANRETRSDTEFDEPNIEGDKKVQPKENETPNEDNFDVSSTAGIVQHISDGMEHMSEVVTGTETTAPFDVTHKSTSDDGQLPQGDQQLTFATLTSEANQETGSDTESEEPKIKGDKKVQPKENESPNEEYFDVSLTAGNIQDEKSSSETRTSLENDSCIQTEAVHAHGKSSQLDESSLPDGVEDLKIKEDSDSKPNNDEEFEEVDVENDDDKTLSMSTPKRKSKLKPDQTKRMKIEDSSDQGTTSKEDPETKSKDEHESTGQPDTDSLHSANKTALSSTTECEHVDNLQNGDLNEDKQRSVFGEAKSWTNPETSILPENSSKETTLFKVDVQKQDKEKEVIPETSSHQSIEETHTEEDEDAIKSDNSSDSNDSDSEQESKQDGKESEGTTNQDEAVDNEKNPSKRQRKNRKKKEGRADKKKKKIEKQKQKNPKSSDKSNKRDESVGNTPMDSGPSTSNSGNSAANSGKSPQFYKVVFHVLVSPEFKFNNKDEDIVIKIGDQTFGKQWEKDFVFEFKRFLAVETAEMICEIKVPHDKVRYGRELSYKYCVRRQKKDPYKWENYVKSGVSGMDANRTLRVPYEWKDEEIWHQYDGFIEKDTKGLVNYVTDLFTWKKKLIAQAKLAVEVFMEQLIQMDIQCQLTTFKVQLEMLMEGLWRTYCVDGRCWNNGDDCRKDIGAIVVSTIHSHLQQEEMDTTEKEKLCKKERRLYYATGVILAFKKQHTSQDLATRRQLCELMLIQPDKDGRCDDIEFMEKHYKKERKTVLEALVSLAKPIASTSKDPCWLYLMPWIHILSDSVRPFQKPEDDIKHDRASAKWWGINHIGKECVDYFKAKSGEWKIPMEQLIEDLFPLFEVDFLLPRTLMAAVELTSLEKVIKTEKIPFEICLAATFFFIRKHTPDVRFYYDGVSIIPSYESKQEQLVRQCTSVLKDYVGSVESIEKNAQNKMIWSLRYRIALQMLNESSMANRNELYSNCAHIVVHSISIFDTFIDDKSTTKEHHTQLQRSVYDVCRWIDKWCWNWFISMEDNLKIWDSFIVSDRVLSKDIKEMWNETVLNRLKDTLKNKVIGSSSLMGNFVQVYCKKVDSFSKDMQEVMSQAAFKAIPMGYNLNYGAFTRDEQERFGRLLSKLFLDEWQKNITSGQRDEERKVLDHVIKWPPFVQYLKIYMEDQSKLKLLSDDCTTAIVQAVSAVESTLEGIVSGTITVGNLNMVCEKDSKFAEITTMLKLRKGCTEDFVLKAIKIRMREMKAFHDQAKLVTTLTTLCAHLSVDVSDVYKTLDKKKDIEKHKVKEFCIPANINEVLEGKDFRPNLCAFNLPTDVIDILPKIHDCNESSTFNELWASMCAHKNKECQTVDDVVTKIWDPVIKSWEDIAKSITNGSISFQRLEKHVGRIFKDDFDSMQKELMCMNIKKDIIKKRLDQLKKYRRIGACVKGAKVILKFQKEYNLTGDFKQIQTIAENDNKVMEMKEFDESVMKMCEFLEEVTDEKANSLNVFVKSGLLVKWLKDSMKSVKELKVFVDLAFMSAGDEPMSIKRVQCLHSAVTGYAPLIFDLKRNVGYKELLKMCELVWKELAADTNLPRKLIDTNSQLEWLKDIKKAHGSVEVTSLIQSDAINDNGIYTVGRKARKDRLGNNVNEMDLDASLKLTVSEIEGKRQQRNYTFRNLQDLQSRLMLVAGKAEKGTDSVHRFTSIFDSVIRLANVNNKLCGAGCVLFKDWTARFLCDKKKPVCAVLEFGQSEGSPTLKAKRDKEDLVAIVPKIAKFMEECLEDWLEYIKEKRSQYIHLNYFTIDQLVILQKELVKMGSEEQPSLWIYPLLSAVKRNCTQVDVLTAMEETKHEIDKDIDMKSDDGDEIVDDEDDSADSEDGLRQKFIKELADAGYDEGLALKALRHVDADQIEDGIVWCMNHEDEMPEEEPTQGMEQEGEPTTEKTPSLADTFQGWSQSTTSIQSLIRSNLEGLEGTKGSSVDSLLEDLQCLWSQFKGSISSNIKDYLNLEHLGMILKNLAARETSRIFREFPPSFQEGSPNLIICPSSDVLNTALSLYMLEKDQPLPQPDEILMCTPQTRIDEVDIFWRRAIFGGGKKIHCLLNADFLDFDVSDAAERYLEKYIQETNYNPDIPRYRLVVICGSDNEYRSRIVASLDKHRRPALSLNSAQLREYLAIKLQLSKADGPIKPAAWVDFNKSTVRVVKSWRAGVGKTLYKSRRENDLERLNGPRVNVKTVSIPLQEKVIDLHHVITRLLKHTLEPGTQDTRLFHIDVAHEVQDGVDYLLFNLLVLGSLTDKTGFVWRKSPRDLYIIETLPLMIVGNNRRREEFHYVHQMLNILPDMTCRSPMESLNVYSKRNQPDGYTAYDQLFDQRQFESMIFQRPYQYLYRLDQGRDLRDVHPQTPEGNPQLCLQTLLRHCGVEDPSWAELHHFVWFLNTQLRDFEQNSFVGAVAAQDLPGFAQFVMRFLIQMSRDFSTRSLNMSEESPGLRLPAERMGVREGQEEEDDDGNQALEQYQLRRTWESSPHPYLFFNADHFTFTFLGFYIDRASGNLIDQSTNQVLEAGIMHQNLYDSLVRNFVPITENFDRLPRDQKITKMCNVMGITMPHDPDDTYELTTDNVKKIMAIYMRFRCDIPVIIMGETGCGKTRLVKFMCGLQMPPGVDKQNMILMKVHGGTTNADIIKKVREAEAIAQRNVAEIGPHMYTVLFFDEANTTESIGLIKEIMCDRSMEGQKLTLCENLKMVAACNPYRKHSEELIKKLEQAGLGYHVDADNTMDKLGRVPMRRLVYRVQPLPQSLLPLVWDFGQLNTQVEDLYIRQMVKRYIRDDRLPGIPNLIEVLSAILTASQDYMRDQKDECSFVSLRDVDRVLSVMSWFYEQSQDGRTLFNKMDALLGAGYDTDSEDEDSDEEESMEPTRGIEDVTRALVLSLGVCYHACLKTRDQYREHIAPYFTAPCVLSGGADQIEEEINCCQEVFLENVELENNIARNMALKENLFMMVVCIELRIPLFLVGKPGSSKSLAKTIASDAMQGNASRKDLFKELKQAQMVSFQCSPLSTPDGIVGTFRQCAQFQKDKDLDTFVSIVVLDEVGLAEDSPRMPLKTLHPLLEDGCQGDEKPEPYMKVAFIGISNWALDPAKMNRGILVQREVPDLEELENSARGISRRMVLQRIEPLISPMCQSYLTIFERASINMREFFGLRDFYSLVKMVNAFAEKSKRTPTWFQMLHAIKRNFGGLEQEKVDPVECFKENLVKIINIYDQKKDTDPDCSAAGLIEACLFERNRAHRESRYLLLLTENYGSLNILQQQIMSRQEDIKPITIFGSSFRSDQEYTQVCRNINKIKVCMETGNTVVLLNLENLYESLYDALNQYYVYFGGERYVDLGLGTHRVKCPVHKKFRLIVVAEKQTVYDKFPIPLINRLEKHFLTINTLLSKEQQALAQRLEDWARQFVKQNEVRPYQRAGQPSSGGSVANRLGNVFMGYHDDTCAAIILQVWETTAGDTKDADQILSEGKKMLLWVATPDAVVRLGKSALPVEEQKELHEIYFKQQKHDSIVDYLHHKLVVEEQQRLFVQVTTHSKLLATFHKVQISEVTHIPQDRIMLLDTLSSFDTEQQFSNKIQHQLQNSESTDPCLLIIQCDSGDINANLVACARYCVMDEYQKVKEELRAPVHVVFIVQLPNIAGGCYTGFQCGVWHSVHIDDLSMEDLNLPAIDVMQSTSVSNLIHDAVKGPVAMETGDEEEYRNTREAMEWQDELSPSADRDVEEGMDTQDPAPSASLKGNTMSQTQGPLDIEDVILGFESAGKKIAPIKEYQGRSLNVKDLILSCTQAALSMLKDKAENNQRTTERVALVLTLFHGTHLQGYELFLQGMCSLIASLLKEKEKNVYSPENWLTNEAAKPENIQKAGTFRRSCLQTLESKISPILAGIIAHLDTNQNLDILESSQSPWKHQLWLDVLNVPGALQLKYSDLQSPKRQTDLQEVVVITTGCEGRIFKSSMPFSWLIHQQMNEIVRQPMPSSDENESGAFTDKIVFYGGVFVQTSLGKVLAQYSNSEHVTEIAEEYLHDFLCMRYFSLSEGEYKLVRQSVRYKYNQLIDEIEGEATLIHHLLCIHEAYKILAPRLTYFHTMNVVWPECSETIAKFKQENPEHIMFREEEFTFSSLCMLIENLTPSKNELDKPEGRSKWLNKVHTFRPVVDKVLRLHREDEASYGAHSYQSVQRARCLWSRVVVMKLFLEHICTVTEEENITVKYFMTMWKVLGDEANLQEIKSLEAIEKILKLCNKKAIQEFLGKQEKCGFCEIELDGPPIVLPCGDLFCDKCYQDIKALGDDSCLKCQKTIPDGWSVERQTEKKTEKLKLKNYQKRCNSFFMDVVSQLCFYDNTPPSDAVIDRLLEYITHTTKGVERTQKTVTKEMTIFNTGLDPNPVFRSFLLQLLMRMSEQKVMENLKKYLKHADSLLNQTDGTDNESYINLGLLIIQCLEDILTQEMSPSVETEEGIKCLKRAGETIFTDELNIEKLYGLAEARIGLRIAAKAIAGLVQQRGGNHNVRSLIEAAQMLCENGHTEFPRIYLVKYMCRCYGIDVYQAVCQSEKRYLMWIGMKGREYNQGVEMSDRLVLCGDTYTSIREALTKVVLGEDCDSLNETLQELRTSKSHVHILFPLAVYREITCSLLYPPAQRKVKDKEVDVLQNFIQNSEDFRDKTWLLKCLQNNIGHPSCLHLTVREGLDFRLQGVQCLLVHFLYVISHLDGKGTLLQPLIGLFKTPQEFANSFLPTMPQDDLEDVKAALLAARQNGGDENPVIYRCPNGHPYVIGNCGRPYVVERCKCGAEIGGRSHNLLPTNRKDAGVDETQTGHILGHPRDRGRGPRPEREMSPPFCACVRLLTHMSMYLGTLNNIQAIRGMIIPALHDTDVSEYLWGHIQADLDDLQRGLGKSPDDVLVLLHTVVDNMMNKHDKGERVTEIQCRLGSKNSRRDWEKRMCDQYLQPIFKDFNQILQQANKRIVDDQRLGADPLLCLLYEIDTQQEEENPNKLETFPAVWRYRSPITIEHLRQEFEAKKLSLSKQDNQLKVLDLFLKQEHYLRAIRCIPSILKLQRELFNTYQRKLDKAEASQITVGYVIRERIAGEDSAQLVDDFIIAWNICRSSLKQYLCPTDLGGMPVPKDYCGSISEETPIAILLPAIKDEGLCSYALMDLLMRKQNDFLEKYFKETANSKKRSPDHMTKVQPMDVTPAHLISYDPQQDLLPLILANCQYSFEIGKGTKIEYDFTSLERQIMDRFLFSKSKIDVGPVLKIDLMTYRAEFTNGEVFKKLEEKIPQDSLSSAVKTQICAEMRTMPDLCQSLYTLDISISFLKSIGGNPNDNLHRFMADTLKMKETILSQKARQTCCFTHIQSLWLLLALEKSKKMAEHRQPMENMFDSVSQEFQAHLPADIEATFRDFMKDISVDKLGELVALLHEYILLQVAAVQNRDDEDYTDTTNLKLQEWLPEYSEGLDRGDNLEQILAGFPDTILYKHSVHAWVTAYSMLCEKQTGDKKF